MRKWLVIEDLPMENSRFFKKSPNSHRFCGSSRWLVDKADQQPKCQLGHHVNWQTMANFMWQFNNLPQLTYSYPVNFRELKSIQYTLPYSSYIFSKWQHISIFNKSTQPCFGGAHCVSIYKNLQDLQQIQALTHDQESSHPLYVQDMIPYEPTSNN